MYKEFSNWVCKECGKISKSKNNLRSHVEANHVTSSELSCPICQKKYKTRDTLRHHSKKCKM